MTITIITPVKNPDQEKLKQFINLNNKYFQEHHLLVIDSGGGEALQPYAKYYLKNKSFLFDARKLGYNLVITDYIMNLDCDVIIPDGYIEAALEKFTDPKLAAVSIFFDDVTHNAGVLEYGISIWKTEIVKKLYDYSPMKVDRIIIKISNNVYTQTQYPFCECSYMWQKVAKSFYKIETLNMRAKHL